MYFNLPILVFYITGSVTRSNTDGEEVSIQEKKVGVCYKAAVSILLPIFSDGFGISTCANVL